MRETAIVPRYSAAASDDILRSDDIDPDVDGEFRDSIGAARGILLCLVVSALLWLMIWRAVSSLVG